MAERTALISGASIAGPALAYFLTRLGYDVTVVERNAWPRDSGYAVDVRGDALAVVADMGLLTELQSLDTAMLGTDVLDADGTPLQRLPAERFAGELELPKHELTRALHRLTHDDVRYVFADHIVAIDQGPDRVNIRFAHARPASFDLVFGADGVSSGVRHLAFEGRSAAPCHLGLSGAGFTTDNILGLDHRGLLHPGPGTAAYVFSGRDEGRMTVSLSFATDGADLDHAGRPDQERAVQNAFKDRRWETPRLLDAMHRSTDFYFASASQVRLDRWSTGRLALLGDAGYCSSPLSGAGTSQALLGAATIGRALADADHDHDVAFAAYERTLRPAVAANQAAGRRAAVEFGALAA